MLVIRMQRTGRKGHAMFRVVVQDSRVTPTSGKVVTLLGSYDPHAKTTTLDKDKASFYLKNGARPSPRVVRLLQAEKVKLPDWVTVPAAKERAIRSPEKLRKNRPAEPAAPVEEPETAPAEETAEPAASDESPAEPVAEEAPTEAASESEEKPEAE